MKRLLSVSLLACASLALTGCVIMQPFDRGDRSDGPGEGVRPSPGASALPAGAVDCSSGSVRLSGSSADFDIVGPCAEVVIEGNDIDLDADAIDSLVIRGDRNDVDADAVGSITIDGQSNEIDADSIGSLRISGDRNTVDADGDVGSVDFSGADNSVDADGAIGSVSNAGPRNRAG